MLIVQWRGILAAGPQARAALTMHWPDALPWRNGGLSGWRDAMPGRADLPGIVALFAYAVAFTVAYLALGAATGALVLFATVQATMVGVEMWRGHRPAAREWIGLLMALAGLVWLLAPGLATPASWTFAWAFAFMAAAGVAWGAYTLIGRGSTQPLAQTARAFVGTAPAALLLIAIGANGTWTAQGAALAAASGVITSGLGYAIWYAVLPRLSAMTAGVSQLLVPAVAALGAAIWLREPLTLTFLAASVLILAGIAISMKRGGP